jgi:hypothetical protein
VELEDELLPETSEASADEEPAVLVDVPLATFSPWFCAILYIMYVLPAIEEIVAMMKHLLPWKKL